MKTKHVKLWIALLAGAALLGAVTKSQAQTFITESYTNTFDTGGNATPFAGSGSVASWIYWYNRPGNNIPITNDIAMDAENNPNSGSLLIYSPFAPENPGDNQNVFFGTFGNQFGYDFGTRANLLNYTNITFDIHVDPSTPTNGNGNFGTIGVGIINASYGYQEFGRPTIPLSATNGWVRLSVNVDHTQNNVSDAPGIAFNYNAYADGYPTFPVTFWIDNVTVNLTPGPPPPPPTVSLERLVPGLTQFADSQPNYNRQNIRSDTNGTADLTWYGRPKPVTYSFTVADFPGPGFEDFFIGLNISPDVPGSQIYSDPDWSATNDLWININLLADGSVRAGIAYKTNQPVGNSQLFAAPTQLIAGNTTNGFAAPSAIGTWTLTFTSDTDMVLTAPNGSSTNASLPADVAALFNGPVCFYLYSAAAENANIGQKMTFSALNIAGVGTPVNEDLTDGTLDTSFLILNSQNYFYTGNYTPTPPNQQFVTSADAFWLHWTKPDAGFSAVVSPILGPGQWSDLGLTNIFSSGGHSWVKVPKTSVPAGDQAWFALLKRQFSKLQVLLPGETAAPGTPTGKTGTPDPVSLSGGGFVTVTINAVDADWNPVNVSGDMINLTSTDGFAIMPLDAPLAGGTLQTVMQFGSEGNWTVTATDVTNTNIPPATSASVAVGP